MGYPVAFGEDCRRSMPAEDMPAAQTRVPKMDLRSRLDELKRKAECNYARKAAVASVGDLFKPMGPGDLDEAIGGRASPEAALPGGPLEMFIHGETTASAGGVFYRVLADAGNVWADAPKILNEYLEILSAPFPPRQDGLEPLSLLGKVKPAEVCYLDIETTGLGNTPLFLVGLMYAQGGGLVLDQLFARDYTEEKAVLEFLSDMIKRFPVLVTFNGERFDIPFIAERMAVEMIDFPLPRAHVDLLPVARKVLGRRTPNHRLQTLEVFLLGRKRKGDIPGSLIPGAYHEYVRTRNAARMAAVIHHNRLDLLSMMELVTVFMSGRDRECRD